MSTINDLAVVSTVDSADKLPLWSNANGVTRGLPLSVLDARYVTQANISAIAASPVVETFVAGTNFTPGTSISLTLANQYFSTSNIEVFFDTSFQGPDQYSLIGFGLTFTSPIPIGVSRVYVRGGTVRIIGTPSNGTVTDASVATDSNLSLGITNNRDVKYFGAKSDGATDDSSAVALAEAAGVALFTAGTTLTNVAQTAATQRWVSFGTDFSGAHPLDEKYPAFGSGALRVAAIGFSNSIIGIVHNNAPANTPNFPTAVTGYGRVDNAGNVVFGLFGRADMYAAGVATSEINTFNFAGAPSISLPPNRGFGTPDINPITLTVAAGGTFPNSIGIHICQEGSTPQPYLTGIYTNADAITSFGICIGANATQGPNTSACFQNTGAGTNLLLQTLGTPAPGNNMILCSNAAATVVFAVKQNGQLAFTSAIVSPSATAGSASALPSTPANYLQILVDGATVKVPYYNI